MQIYSFPAAIPGRAWLMPAHRTNPERGHDPEPPPEDVGLGTFTLNPPGIIRNYSRNESRCASYCPGRFLNQALVPVLLFNTLGGTCGSVP